MTTTPDENCAPFCVYHAGDECTGTPTTTDILREEEGPATALTVYPFHRDDIDLTGVYLAQAKAGAVLRGVYLTPAQARDLAAALTGAARTADGTSR